MMPFFFFFAACLGIEEQLSLHLQVHHGERANTNANTNTNTISDSNTNGHPYIGSLLMLTQVPILQQ